mmetsp:Transcript_21936/g.70031  ORF Transcript_21936/g.70031 Transcript_21936/m.70031 type:complete len:93 (-) Transcript_21936:260-538(-)
MRPHVVVFVVDVNDESRIDEARAEFNAILHDPNLCDSLLLVLGNQKGDSKMQGSELREQLGVPRENELLMVDAMASQNILSCVWHICQALSR